MQCQQVGISCNDRISPAIQCHFQKLVIFGVAAFADQLNDGDELGDRAELHKEHSALVPADIEIKLWAE